MKAVLTILAILPLGALPLRASAQPAVDSGPPTAVSGITVAAPRRFTQLSGVTVQTFLDMRPCRKAADGPWPARLFDQSRIRLRTGARPGTEDFVRKDSAAIDMGDRDYGDMAPRLAAIARLQLPILQDRLKCLGTLQSIAFKRVSAADYDVYEIDFKNGAMEWAVSPPNEAKRHAFEYMRFYAPQPLTRDLRDLIASLQKAHPDRRAVSPALAAELEDRWPALRERFKGWGRLESIDFVRQTDAGAYVYLVTLGHGGASLPDAPLRTAWMVKVEPETGKLVSMTYAVFSDASAKPADSAAGAGDEHDEADPGTA